MMELNFFKKHKKIVLAAVLVAVVFGPIGTELAYAQPVDVLDPVGWAVYFGAATAKLFANGEANCVLYNPATWAICVINGVNDLINLISTTLLSWILTAVASVMDFAIKLSLDTSYLKDNLAIGNGWKLIRDLVNMGFIFILLYIAISTILQSASYNMKSMLAKLIIAAVLINFSLFITKVVMDAGNIVAVNFYNSFAVSLPGQAQPQPSIGAVFKNYLQLPDQYNPVTGAKLDSLDKFFSTIMRALTMSVAIYVFFKIMFLFIARILAFVFIMIFSPIGFIGAVFPGASGAAAKWRKTLIDQTLVAPVFLILIYLAAKMIESPIFNAVSSQFSEPNVADSVNAGFYFKYVIVIGFLLMALKITKNLSGEMGAMVEKFGKKALAVAAGATLAVATGGAALAGRAAIGRGAAAIASSGGLKDMAAQKGIRGFVGRTGIALSSKVADSSFEARNVGMFQKAAGLAGIKVAKTKTGEGGFKGVQEKKTEKVREFAEKLAPSAAETRQKAESYAAAKAKKDNLEKQAEQNVKNRPGITLVTEADKQANKAALDKAKKDLADKQAELKMAQSVNPQAAATAQTRLNQAQQALTQAENRKTVIENNGKAFEQQKQTEVERLAGSPDKLKDMNQEIIAKKKELDMVTPNAQGITPRQQDYAQQQKQPGVGGGGPAAGAERGVGNAADALAEKIREAMVEAGGEAAEQMAKAMGTSTENLKKELGLAMADLNKVRPGATEGLTLRNNAFDNLEERIKSLEPAFSTVSNESGQKVSQSIAQIKQGLANISQPSITESVIQKVTWTPEWKREAADKIIAGEKLKKKKGGKDQKKFLEDLAELLGEELPSSTSPAKPPTPPSPPTPPTTS